MYSKCRVPVRDVVSITRVGRNSLPTQCIEKGGTMIPIRRVIAALMLATVGFGGCAYEGRSGAGANTLSVEDLRIVMRDLWSGHNF